MNSPVRDVGMTSLIGTTKQVASAETIRQKQLAEIEQLKGHPIRGKRFSDPASYESRALNKLLAIDEAEAWIRRRHNSGAELLGGAIAALKLASEPLTLEVNQNERPQRRSS